LAATVISRLSLENRAERFLSCAPFRYMMFLNLLWPAMVTPFARAERIVAGLRTQSAKSPTADVASRNSP
jgi:hypothetical protein